MIGATILASVVALGVAGYNGKLGSNIQKILGRKTKTSVIKNLTPQQKAQEALSNLYDKVINKAQKEGKNVVRIGRFEPASKLCTCGYKNNNLTLKDREWTCPICNTHHDRDILAANNIKRFALQEQNLVYTGLGRPEEHVDSLTKVKGMKHE